MTELALALLHRPVSLLARLRQALGQAWRRAAVQRRWRADRQTLREMDDHGLRDLGIARDEIQHWTTPR
jgi:uncharacterized protein YjiS (DUF1127 family)